METKRTMSSINEFHYSLTKIPLVFNLATQNFDTKQSSACCSTVHNVSFNMKRNSIHTQPEVRIHHLFVWITLEAAVIFNLERVLTSWLKKMHIASSSNSMNIDMKIVPGSSNQSMSREHFFESIFICSLIAFVTVHLALCIRSRNRSMRSLSLTPTKAALCCLGILLIIWMESLSRQVLPRFQ